MMMAAHQFPERMMTNDVKTTRFSTITKTRGRRASRRPRRRRACNHLLSFVRYSALSEEEDKEDKDSSCVVLFLNQ